MNMAEKMVAFQIRREKKRIFIQMRDEVQDCTRCINLCSVRRNAVFGGGNPSSRLMFIGEAPGAEEDNIGVPFVGRAGKLLDNILSACELSRDNVYIANVIKCRPAKNRLPTSDEIKNCIGYLEKQIEVVNPDFIVCLGSVASQAIVGVPISDARGRWYDYKHHKVICTYHPAFLLRNPEAKKIVWDDLQPLLQAMRE